MCYICPQGGYLLIGRNMPRKKKVIQVKEYTDSFEKKSLEELVCHTLDHISIDMEPDGNYSADVVCRCGERISFGRAAWERICEHLAKAAEDEKNDAGLSKPG